MIEAMLMGGGMEYYLAYITHIQPFVRIRDTSDFSLLTGVPEIPVRPHVLKFSPSGRYLAIGNASSPNGDVLNVIDMETLTLVEGLPQPASGVTNLAWSPDENYLAITANTLYAPDNFKVIDLIQKNFVSGVSITTNRSASTNAKNSIAFNNSGSRLAVTTQNGTGQHLFVFDTSDWSSVSVSSMTWQCTNLVYSDEDDYLILTLSGAQMIAVDARNDAYSSRITIGNVDAQDCSSLTFIDSNKLVLTRRGRLPSASLVTLDGSISDGSLSASADNRGIPSSYPSDRCNQFAISSRRLEYAFFAYESNNESFLLENRKKTGLTPDLFFDDGVIFSADFGKK